MRLSVYPELDHSAGSGAFALEWLSFIDELFNGYSLDECSMETVRPLYVENARAPAEEEFRGCKIRIALHV